LLIAVNYAIVYNPIIRALDEEFKRVQAILPFDVMRSAAALTRLLF